MGEAVRIGDESAAAALDAVAADRLGRGVRREARATARRRSGRARGLRDRRSGADGQMGQLGRARPSSSPVVSCSRARSPTATARGVARELVRLGFEVAHVLIVGDRPDDLDGGAAVRRRRGLRAGRHQRRARADGRRPHRRGRGRPSPASPLELDEDMRAHIAGDPGRVGARNGFAGPALEAANRKQAMVPRGAVALTPVGTAPGLVVPRPGGPLVVVLPGPAAGAAAGCGPPRSRPRRCAALLAAGARRGVAVAALLRAARVGDRGHAARARASGPVRRRGHHLPAPLRAGGRPAAAARRRGRRRRSCTPSWPPGTPSTW